MFERYIILHTPETAACQATQSLSNAAYFLERMDQVRMTAAFWHYRDAFADSIRNSIAWTQAR